MNIISILDPRLMEKPKRESHVWPTERALKRAASGVGGPGLDSS